MKIGFHGLGCAGLLVAVGLSTGCAVDGAHEGDGVEASLLDGAEGEMSMKGETYTLNCAGSLPGFPAPPCLPELTFTQTATQIIEPGGNLAPGYYIQFGFKNDSKKAAGPFDVRITDAAGNTIQTVPFAGLAAGASTSVIAYAPYECGWKRTVILDSSNKVAEAVEWNNTSTYSNLCKRY